MKRFTWPMLAVTAMSVAPVPAMASFRCPAADAPTKGEKASLSADDMAGAGLSDPLKSTIHRMLTEGTQSGAVVDRLVVADCSKVDAEPNLSDAAKAEQVRRFASKIANFVYTTPGRSEEDIVLDVPVPAPRFEQLRRAADKAGVSEDAWVNEAIAAKLAKP